ncbi:glycosyltransferase [Rhodanobacter sp. DHB23]|uniref:glycosyltransferase n=1 Tax=Rhodanobacter sp. DHB23 TaxID=2775923 RepID=UPI00177B1F5C|nr:glycosyltransferase [Rhodanobacter sp. DHB23]MBD8872218.1 glycosyltransferase [Rhodanobacter sp. DHB23]
MHSSPHPQPLISVAISVYNGARFLPLQMDSILTQQDVRLEVVAVDDGSSDESLAILNAYAARDPRVRVHANPGNLGLTRSFERAMSLCRGEYLAPSDQDDIWHPAKLSRLLAAIGDRAMAYCDSCYIDEAGTPTGRRVSDDVEMLHGTNPMQFVFANSASGHAMLLRRELFERACPLEPALYYDWQLALYAAASAGVVLVDEPLVQFRRHAQAFSAIGKASPTRVANRNLVWFDERGLLLRAWMASNLGDSRRAGRMLQAIEGAYRGAGNLPLFAAVWRERRAMHPGRKWPVFAAIKLYSRLLRKLRRAHAEAGNPAANPRRA